MTNVKYNWVKNYCSLNLCNVEITNEMFHCIDVSKKVQNGGSFDFYEQSYVYYFYI